jgi:hypothetical protein
MSYADLQPSMCKPCANFERALPQGYGGFLRVGAADGMAPCMLEKFERVAQSSGFRDLERMRRAFIRASSAPSPAVGEPRGRGSFVASARA